MHQPSKEMAKRPRRKPAQSRRGPKPLVPSSADRQGVMLAVAAGMSLELIADALEVSRRTLCRTFARELAIGRAKKMLENIRRLDAAAAAGNVSAMKYFHALMLDRHGPGENVGEDRWAAVANQIEADMDAEANPNLPKNPEFWKSN